MIRLLIDFFVKKNLYWVLKSRKKKERRIIIERILKTLYWFIVIAIAWQVLELVIYGEVQPRLVDDIIGLIFPPLIYKAMKE